MSLRSFDLALDRLEEALDARALGPRSPASPSPGGPLAVVASSVPLRSTDDNVRFLKLTISKCPENDLGGSSKADANLSNPQPGDGQRFDPYERNRVARIRPMLDSETTMPDIANPPEASTDPAISGGDCVCGDIVAPMNFCE